MCGIKKCGGYQVILECNVPPSVTEPHLQHHAAKGEPTHCIIKDALSGRKPDLSIRIRTTLMYEDVNPHRDKFNGEHATPVHHSRPQNYNTPSPARYAIPPNSDKWMTSLSVFGRKPRLSWYCLISMIPMRKGHWIELINVANKLKFFLLCCVMSCKVICFI